jgi:transposase-like protein
VIVLAVGWFLRFGLSYRDVEELLAERGVDVDHVSVYRWVQRFTPYSPTRSGRADTPSATVGSRRDLRQGRRQWRSVTRF